MPETATNMPAAMPSGRAGRLHLVPPAGDFDPETDICLDPRISAGPDSLFARHPYRDQARLVTDSAVMAGIANALCLRLGQRQEEKYRTGLGFTFWRTVLIRWMFDITQSGWQRYVVIENAVRLLRERDLEVAVWLDCVPPRPRNSTESAYHLQYDRQLQWWIDSLVVAALAPENWELVASTPAEHGIQPYTPPPAGSEAPETAVRRLKRYLGAVDSTGTRWGSVALAAITKFGPKASPRPPEREDETLPETAPPAVLEVLGRMIDALLPHSLDDGVPELLAETDAGGLVPGRVRIGALDGYNDRQKVEIGQAKAAGERLIQTQHGAFYGILRAHPVITHIEYREDAFLSWGFTRHDGVTDRLLPAAAPKLCAIREKHRGGKHYMFVGSDIRFDDIHMCTRPRGPAWIDYVDWKKDFLAALPGPVRDRIHYRPDRRFRNDLDDVAAVRQVAPDMPLAEGDIVNWQLTSKAVILDYPGTTLNQCLAAGTPTVCFWKPSDWLLDEAAEPWFDALRRAAILHDDPQSAAAHLARIDGDIDGWWSSPDVRTARQGWSRQFARTGRFWLLEWIAIYLRFVRQSRLNAPRPVNQEKERAA